MMSQEESDLREGTTSIRVNVSLLACGPVDTREVAMDFDHVTLRQTGIAGSTVIEGRTTLHVDVEEMTQQLV